MEDNNWWKETPGESQGHVPYKKVRKETKEKGINLPGDVRKKLDKARAHQEALEIMFLNEAPNAETSEERGKLLYRARQVTNPNYFKVERPEEIDTFFRKRRFELGKKYKRQP